LSRLRDGPKGDSWEVFFETYWRLIYTVARKQGLEEAEAEDVVQDTVVAVTQAIARFRSRGPGSFKGWLLTITRRKVADCFRQRLPVVTPATGTNGSRMTTFLSSQADPESGWDRLWEEEWQRNILAVALERIKQDSRPNQFEMFRRYVVLNEPAKAIAAAFDVPVSQVYMAKLRLGPRFRREVRRLRRAEDAAAGEWEPDSP